MLLFADQAAEHEVNPWLDMWRSEFGYAASELRDLAATQAALDEGIDSELMELSDSLDDVANLRLYIGSGHELQRTTTVASERARDIMARSISRTPRSESSRNHIRDVVSTASRKPRDLTARAKDMVNSGRIEELQQQSHA